MLWLSLFFSKEINPQLNWGRKNALVKISPASLKQAELKRIKPPSIIEMISYYKTGRLNNEEK